MNVVLVMFKSDGSRRDFPLRKERMVVGRVNSCDLRVPLSSVSRQHCEILIDDQQIRVRDLGSSNGTYVNSNRVQETNLAAGDELVIGPVVFTVVVDGQPAEIEPVRSLVQAVAKVTGVEGGRDGSRLEKPSQPTQLPVHDKDSELPQVEAEHYTPTVDLDDPIAALEAMAESDQDSSDDQIPNLSDEIELDDDDDSKA